MSFIFFSPAGFVCAVHIILGMCSYHWSIVSTPRAPPLRKTDSSTTRSHQLSISLQLEVVVGSSVSLTHATLVTGLILYTFVQAARACVSSWLQLYCHVQKRVILRSSTTRGSYNLSSWSSFVAFDPGGSMRAILLSFEAGYSIDTICTLVSCDLLH